MSNNDSPAGSAGGAVTVPGLDDLPEKMRVHALARLIGRTSREVIAALGGLGVEVRGAQSSIDRKAAEQVVTALVELPEAIPAASIPAASISAASIPAAPPAPTPAAVAPVVAEPEPAVVVPQVRNTGLTPLFSPPAPLFQPPARPSRTRRRSTEPEPEPEFDEASHEPTESDTADSVDHPVDDGLQERVDDIGGETGEDTGEDTGDDDEGAARRRRRRGRRGRGRGRGGDESDENGDSENGDSEDGAEEPAGAQPDASGAERDGAERDGAEQDEAEQDEAEQDEGTGTRRRRRRRRRKGSGEDGDDTADAGDPPHMVTRVRQPRSPAGAGEADGDGVQSVRGSTRLEAKRQRRRDGRDAGRRRVPVLSEAEFLARRESVDRTMVVRERGARIEIGVLEDEVLVEHFVADAGHDGTGKSLVGNIYLGRVQNVLPSMEAAFVDIGRGRNAVLYAGEVDWDAAGLGGKARRIEQALSSGDAVLVQVTKDSLGHKGARLTTQISLAGRFLVYVPSGGAAGISRKLPDIERKRLKDMLKEIVPQEAGVIIRTASEGVSHEALERDVRRLQAQWEVVKERSEKTGPNKPKAPVLLYEEPDLLIKVVRDQFNEDFSRLIIQGDDGYDTLTGYLGHVAPELAERVHRHVGTQDVFAEYRIDEQLLKALDRKVWLPSGGTLVIDRTEAMTVVDVNTGKFTGSGGNLEETVTRNNLEAAEEIVRQLRLRDIGGIIVVDFIDMVLEANRDLVLRRLTECLSRDRTRHQVAEVTSLGLVQMTRKRVGGGLLEHFSEPCEHCRGRGVVVNTEPVTEHDFGRPERVSEPTGGRRTRGGRGRRDSADRDGLIAVGNPGIGAAATADAAVIYAPAIDAQVLTGSIGPAVEVGMDAAADAVEETVVERTPAAAADAETAATNGRGRAPRRRGRVTRTAGAPTVAGGDAPAVVPGPVPGPAESAPVAGPGVAGPPGPQDAQPQDAQPVAAQPRAAQPGAAEPTIDPSGTDTPGARTPAAYPSVSGPSGVDTSGVGPSAAGPQPADPAAQPRRSRRTASRPAGPPAGRTPSEPASATGAEQGAGAGGDPM